MVRRWQTHSCEVAYQHLAWIGIGSNLGDSKETILSAWERLGSSNQVQTLQLSSLYRTAPVGMKDPDSSWFINSAGVLSTDLRPEELLTRLLALETIFGRKKNDQKHQGYQNRTLDLDLLLYDNVIIKSPTLQIPHPRLHERGFVLVPLAELSSEILHPVLKKSVAALCNELPPDEVQQIARIQ